LIQLALRVIRVDRKQALEAEVGVVVAAGVFVEDRQVHQDAFADGAAIGEDLIDLNGTLIGPAEVQEVGQFEHDIFVFVVELVGFVQAVDGRLDLAVGQGLERDVVHLLGLSDVTGGFLHSGGFGNLGHARISCDKTKRSKL